VVRLQRGLWQAAALAVAAHAALLTQLPALRPAAPWGQGGSTTHPFQMRLIPLPMPVEAIAAAAPEGPAMAAPLEGPALAVAPPRPAAAQPAATGTVAPGTPSGSSSLTEAPYLARDRLGVAPVPLALIDVQFPQDVAGTVDLRIKVTLYIDEQGVVRRVQLDSPDTPPAFARAVIETLNNTRFSPGTVENVAVRAKIRMEIEFRAPSAGAQASGGLSAPATRTPPSLRAPAS